MVFKKMMAAAMSLTLAGAVFASCSSSDDSSSKKDSSSKEETTAATTTAAPETTTEATTTAAPEITPTNNTFGEAGKYGSVSITWADGVNSHFWTKDDCEGLDLNSNWMPIDKNGDYTITMKVWDTSDGLTDADFSPCTDLAVLCLDWTVTDDMVGQEGLTLTTKSVTFDGTTTVSGDDLDFATVVETLNKGKAEGEGALNDAGNNWENETTFRQNLYNTWGGNIFAFDYGKINYPTYNYITIEFTVSGLAE